MTTWAEMQKEMRGYLHGTQRLLELQPQLAAQGCPPPTFVTASYIYWQKQGELVATLYSGRRDTIEFHTYSGRNQLHRVCRTPDEVNEAVTLFVAALKG